MSRTVLVLAGLLLAVATRQAVAQEVTMDDLKGRSIVAEHWFTENNTIIEEDGSSRPHYNAQFKFKDMIYVAQTGRTFHRTQYFDLNPGFEREFPQFDNVRPQSAEALEFVPGKGLVYRRIPGDTRRDATYLAVVTISFTKSGSKLSCSVSRSRLLKNGATEYMEYIDPDRPKRRKILQSQKVYRQECTVTEGNIFARNQAGME